MTPASIRSTLINTLRLDLIDPDPDEPGHATYVTESPPSQRSAWYLTGFRSEDRP